MSGAHRTERPNPVDIVPFMNIRLIALAGVVACAIALPLAVASAGPVGDQDPEAVRLSRHTDAKAPSPEPADAPGLLGLGLATAARCGPELTSPDGIEAQTCVMTQGEDTWARTYYRNASGDALDSVLSLMGPGGRTMQMRCPIGADDEPATCETPREQTRGDLGAYTAVAEFSRSDGGGPLLLRSGSDQVAASGQ